MSQKKLHDPACYDLARHFLGGLASERLASELAQHIQDAIEDWIVRRGRADQGRVRKAAAMSTEAEKADRRERDRERRMMKSRDAEEAEFHREVKTKMDAGMSFDEAWIASGGDILATTESSAEAVEEVRKAYEKIGNPPLRYWLKPQ